MSRERLPSDPGDLLSTKLTVPFLRAPLVAREPLLERLDEGLKAKLTLISAPAGFGKTTLVRAWIDSRARRDPSPFIAWVSLDAGDNDPVRFWRYVLTAIQAAVGGEIGKSALALLNSAPQPPYGLTLRCGHGPERQFGPPCPAGTSQPVFGALGRRGPDETLC